MSAPATPTSRKVLARNVVPWVVAVVALAYVLHHVRWDELRDAFQKVPFVPFALASLGLLWLNCAADCLAMYYTFGWFGCRLPYRELFVIRAATYLFAVIQYYVGQAMIVGFLKVRAGVDPWRASGFILFISGINMGVLVLLASFGLATSATVMPWMRWVPVGVAVGSVFYAALLRLKPASLMRLKPFAPLFEMGIVGHVKATLIRIPHVLVIIVWHFMALRMFGVPVPVLDALVYLPAVFFIAALPISVQGLGMSQGAAVYFFAHGDGMIARVVAYSLAMTGVSLIVQLSMGFLFMPAANRLGIKRSAPADEGARPGAGRPAEAAAAAAGGEP